MNKDDRVRSMMMMMEVDIFHQSTTTTNNYLQNRTNQSIESNSMMLSIDNDEQVTSYDHTLSNANEVDGNRRALAGTRDATTRACLWSAIWHLTLVQYFHPSNRYSPARYDDRRAISRPGLCVLVACRDGHVRNKRANEMMKNLNVDMEHAVVDPDQSA